MNSKTELALPLKIDSYNVDIADTGDSDGVVAIVDVNGKTIAQVSFVSACNTHTALQSRCEALEKGLEELVKEFDDLDEHRPLHAGCIQCTQGATPDRYRTGPCAYHAARALLEQRT